MKQFFSTIRCASCGSGDVILDKKKEGYSVKKGILGQALFGLGGAAMGVNGKETTYYHCRKCGQVLSYAMPLDEAQNINQYLENPEKYETMLEIKKQRYPNIEWTKGSNITDKKESIITEDVDNSAEIKGQIIMYLNASKTIIERGDLINYIISLNKNIQDFFESSNYRMEVVKAIRDLTEKYMIIQEDIGDGKYYYRTPKNVEETKAMLKRKELISTIRDLIKVIPEEIYNKYKNIYHSIKENESELEEFKKQLGYNILKEVPKNEICDKYNKISQEIIDEDFNTVITDLGENKALAKTLIRKFNEEVQKNKNAEIREEINNKRNEFKQYIMEQNLEKAEECEHDIEKMLDSCEKFVFTNTQKDNYKLKLKILKMLAHGQLSIKQINFEFEELGKSGKIPPYNEGLSHQKIQALCKSLQEEDLIKITEFEPNNSFDYNRYLYEIKWETFLDAK